MFAEILPWIAFTVFILAMLAIDLLVFHKDSHTVSMKEALIWSSIWIGMALLFNGMIYFRSGLDAALTFLTAYLIEKSLSVDNLFVFLLIFKYFHVPKTALHKVLFWGIIGALVMRMIFIFAGIALISNFHWIIYLFGAFLIYSGIMLGLEKDKKVEPEKNIILKLFKRFFKVTDHFEGDKFFIKRGGRYLATPLFVVLLSIESTDLVFAADSIPAVLAITYDPFIVYTSNIFAILGLRSLFFVLEGMMSLFHYLHYGLSLILVFIGIKMVLSSFYQIPTVIALLVVFLLLTGSILSSLIFPLKQDHKQK